MSNPRVPSGDDAGVDLPCGEAVRVGSLDMGMRDYDCPCGERHAVVMDVHPPERFLPEFLVSVLRDAVETTSDDLPEFGTPHLMGMVLEEFPEAMVAKDCSQETGVGWAMLWVTHFDSRRLHEVVVELVVEMMEHAVSHADDDSAMTEFERQMLDFDVSEFVAEYRDQRDLSEDDVYV